MDRLFCLFGSNHNDGFFRLWINCDFGQNIFSEPLKYMQAPLHTLPREITTEQGQGKYPIVRNAVHCGICDGSADRYINWFQCQNNPNHVGDLTVGIFSDLTYPSKL